MAISNCKNDGSLDSKISEIPLPCAISSTACERMNSMNDRPRIFMDL